MAQKKVTPPSFTMGSADDFLISSPGQGGQLSALHIHLVNNGATFSLKVKGISVNAPSTATYLETPYCPLYASGTGADSSMVAGSVALTDTSIIMVPASAENIALSMASISGGTVSAYVTPVYGPSVI